jgi:hypothetical protein
MLNATDQLPVEKGENTLVLLVQSPRVLFTYWEVSAAVRESLKGREMVLRLCTAENGRFSPREVVAPPFFAGDWYFRDVIPGGHYRCELGWTENGGFYPLLYSEVVETPPDKAAWAFPVPGRRVAGKAGDPAPFVEAAREVGISSGVLWKK